MAGIGFKYVQRGPNLIDLVTVQGKTFIFSYTAPTGVTVSNARWVVYSDSDNSILFEMNISNSRTVIAGQTVTYTMSASEMAALNAPFYGAYENEIVTDLGTIQALKGRFTVEKEWVV